MKTSRSAIMLMFVTTFFTSVAQLFYKEGASRLTPNLLDLIFNYPLIIGLALYGCGAIIMIIALRSGEVSVLYPIIATSYIWVTLFAKIFFNENVTILRWLGVLTIMIGITIIGRASKDGAMTYTEGV